ASDGSHYSFTAGGEMSSGAGRSLDWAAFGKARKITKGANTVHLYYGPNHARYKKTVTQSGESVYYLQGAERLTVAGNASLRRTLSLAGLTVIDTGGAQAKLLYAVKDHLGSTMALTKANGQLTTQMSFSPFGQRRTHAWAQSM